MKCDIYCLHIFSPSLLEVLFMNEERNKDVKAVASFDTSFGSERGGRGREWHVFICI